MIDKLIELGIRDIDINNIKEFIQEDNYEDFINILNLLEYIGCDIKEIINIIVGNPHILERSYEDVLELVNYLLKLNFTSLKILFDSYPVFLNKNKFEIEDYINIGLQNGMIIEDIIDELENNPLLIEEM